MTIDQFVKISDIYQQHCQNTIVKSAKIKKLPSGKYRVLSQRNRNLGTFSSKKAAEKRLKQVEYFKYLDTLDLKPKKELDLSKIKFFSLSAIMRELNKIDPDIANEFIKEYKFYFDQAVKSKMKNVPNVALDHALKKFKKLYKIKIKNKLVKVAASLPSLGDPKTVGNYLANIVKFILNRISPAKRQKSINRLKQKFYYLNENELGSKKMPASSSLGQSITFVKTVLFNHNPRYIREVLNNLVRYL
jgi:hypothetical protein